MLLMWPAGSDLLRDDPGNVEWDDVSRQAGRVTARRRRRPHCTVTGG